ncbi:MULTISPECIES: RNA-guided endonuclease TnpB family protein [Bacteria]|uniref:RNA-guided endonuclease InsQ/TnpB family protein n=1 Tax=Pseudomonadati TaxID=3379134 RepID=UPI0004B860D8|nr:MULTISPECIES: RNA-guided endonuclease TnpB family protein [Bacteria]
MLRAYRLELEIASERKRRFLHQHFGAARFIYNWALRLVREKGFEFFKQGKGGIGKRILYYWREERDKVAPWHHEINAHTFNGAVLDLGRDLKHHSPSQLRGRSRNRHRSAHFYGIKLQHIGRRSIKLPGSRAGEFRGGVYLKVKKGTGKLYEDIQQGRIRTIKRITVSERAGRYFASVLCEVQEPEPLPCTGRVCGLDVGISSIVTVALSDGRIIKQGNPQWLAKKLRRLRRIQRSLARCKTHFPRDPGFKSLHILRRDGEVLAVFPLMWRRQNGELVPEVGDDVRILAEGVASYALLSRAPDRLEKPYRLTVGGQGSGANIELSTMRIRQGHPVRVVHLSVDRSHTMERRRKTLARAHYRVSVAREDFWHRLSTWLVRNCDVIVVESLSIKGMLRSGRFSRHIADAAWGTFFQMLQYKCERYGRTLLRVERSYPSSKKCSRCGKIRKALSLSERTYRCDQCGLKIDRDENAALNLMKLGLAHLTSPTARLAGSDAGGDTIAGGAAACT